MRFIDKRKIISFIVKMERKHTNNLFFVENIFQKIIAHNEQQNKFI
jgi:hypothetical protein